VGIEFTVFQQITFPWAFKVKQLHSLVSSNCITSMKYNEFTVLIKYSLKEYASVIIAKKFWFVRSSLKLESIIRQINNH